MAKGAAIAALVYFGLIFLAIEALILFGGAVLSTLIHEAMANSDYSSTTDLSSSGIIAILAIVVLIAFIFPLGFAVWMLLGAVKNSAVNVLIPLIIFSAFSLISLLGSLNTSRNENSTIGATIAANLVWYVILAFSWVGWARMNSARAANSSGTGAPSAYQAYPGYPVQNPGYPAPSYPARGYPEPNAGYPTQNTGYPAPAPSPEPYGTPAQGPDEQFEPTRRLPPPQGWTEPEPQWQAPGSAEPTPDEPSPWSRPGEQTNPGTPRSD